ncbi:GTPase Era [Bryobacterales bacterium F-183]|nr:GTPase Era [Bryobacterales bacterium F-183]
MARKTKPKHKCGFISILGRPNAGKSTLLNALLGEKIAIVASKPQTTRTVIQGVLTEPNSQMIFLDTPGIHKSTNLFNRRMMQQVRESVDDRDLLLYLVDATSRPDRDEELQAIDLVKSSTTPAFLVLNKIDKLASKELLLERIQQYQAIHEGFKEFVPISAIKADGLDGLKRAIYKYLPEGPAIFDADYLTDQPERFLVGELVREKILRATHQEVPHSVAVLIDKWEQPSDKLTRIAATIYVERSGQKAIIIGKGGELLKKVGTNARRDIEKFLDTKVFLELFVKVREDWREDPQFLNEIDWRAMLGK